MKDFLSTAQLVRDAFTPDWNSPGERTLFCVCCYLAGVAVAHFGIWVTHG